MAEPMRIRAQMAGDKATVRVLMSHEMESGQRRDSAGKLIPAWHIQEVEAKLNGKSVMTAEWGPAVSKNPFLQFNVKGAKVGDKMKIYFVNPDYYGIDLPNRDGLLAASHTLEQMREIIGAEAHRRAGLHHRDAGHPDDGPPPRRRPLAGRPAAAP